MILDRFARWTVLSALRSGAPIRSAEDVYAALADIDFHKVLDRPRGRIVKKEFERWHGTAIRKLMNGSNGKLRHGAGWAAKMVNVYLKTACYVGKNGRPGLEQLLHPPLDSKLWSGIKNCRRNAYDRLLKCRCIGAIKSIRSLNDYRRIVRHLRSLAKDEGCSLVELEKFWKPL